MNSKTIISESGHDYETAIAVMIAIENRSRKNRSAILIFKSISDFNLQIDQRF